MAVPSVPPVRPAIGPAPRRLLTAVFATAAIAAILPYARASAL
ncbi:MAG: hypothetical protein WCK28_04475 [Burkholderiales bacterium]